MSAAPSADPENVGSELPVLKFSFENKVSACEAYFLAADSDPARGKSGVQCIKAWIRQRAISRHEKSTRFNSQQHYTIIQLPKCHTIQKSHGTRKPPPMQMGQHQKTHPQNLLFQMADVKPGLQWRVGFWHKSPALGF